MHSYKHGSLQGSHTTIFGIVVDRGRIATEALRAFLAYAAHERKFYNAVPSFHFRELGRLYSYHHTSVNKPVGFSYKSVRTLVFPEPPPHL
jgi:hypothetical protein